MTTASTSNTYIGRFLLGSSFYLVVKNFVVTITKQYLIYMIIWLRDCFCQRTNLQQRPEYFTLVDHSRCCSKETAVVCHYVHWFVSNCFLWHTVARPGQIKTIKLIFLHQEILDDIREKRDIISCKQYESFWCDVANSLLSYDTVRKWRGTFN